MFNSSIARKVLMALTGLGLLGFVVGHLAGNLQIFLGQEALNAYAKFLKDNIALIWPARIGLLAILFVHVVVAIQLTRANKRARGSSYRYQASIQASAASRYMIHSGMIILIFVIVHLLHFTLGCLDPENYHLVDSKGRHDVYSMVVLGFQDVYYSGGYLVAMLALGAHLSHALSSVFQTLGFNHERYTPKIKVFAPLVAWGIALGYAAIPLSVLVGIISLPSGV